MNWIVKLFAALIVWVIAALLAAFVGGLLHNVDQVQIKAVGDLLKDNAGLIGFLAGAAYFIWGRVPNWPQRRVS
jgi:hypothetical protein